MQTQDNAQFHIVLVKGWVEKDGKYLMAKRSQKEIQAPGTWSIPGGKMEAKDGPHVVEEHLKEEVKEEVGIEIKDEVELIYTNAFTRVDGAHVVGLTFLCHWKSGEAQPLDDTDEVKWFSLEELKNSDHQEKWMQKEIEALTKYKSY